MTNSQKDIWTLISDKTKKQDQETQESVILFLGSKNSGKSSLIGRFLDREEAKTQTVALEYTFCRKTRGAGSIKDIVHLWELAAGLNLVELIDCPVTDSNISILNFAIVVDLSNVFYTYLAS